ncbi:MAG: hypothetical protein ABSD48_20435, partial [Armatimonadota bacterium]
NGIDVVSLHLRVGLDRLSAIGDEHDILEEDVLRLGATGTDESGGVLDLAGRDRMAALEQLAQFGDQLGGPSDLLFSAADADLVSPRADVSADLSLDQAQVLVMVSGQGKGFLVIGEDEFGFREARRGVSARWAPVLRAMVS